MYAWLKADGETHYGEKIITLINPKIWANISKKPKFESFSV